MRHHHVIMHPACHPQYLNFAAAPKSVKVVSSQVSYLKIRFDWPAKVQRTTFTIAVPMLKSNEFDLISITV